MTMLERLKARYGQYEQESRQAVEKAKPTDGLFGMGNDPRKDPCHDRFYEDVAAWVQEFLETAPDPQAAADAAEWILRAADAHREQEVYWYMYAAQGHALELIRRMPQSRSETLLRWYDEAYPKIERMPVHREVYKLLRKVAKAKK